MYTKMEWLTITFVVGMVLVAELFDVKDIIFPEIAALAFGAWVMEDRPWPGPVWTIWFSPTLAAITGVVILRTLPASVALMVFIALICVFIELKVVGSHMSPAISAAILPIIINAKGIVYPISVFIMTGSVALLVYNKKRKCKISGIALHSGLVECVQRHDNLISELFHYGKLVVFVLLIAILADTSGWLYIVSPPLIVAFVELTYPGSLLREKSMKKLLVLLTSCSLEGMLWVVLVGHCFSGPLWLAAGLSVATAFLIARSLRLASPPAFALSLLPIILPRSALYLYPLSVFAGAALFIIVSKYFFKLNSGGAMSV